MTAEEEDAGLDIAEHGMYGYPEQFIPDTEIGAGSEIAIHLRPKLKVECVVEDSDVSLVTDSILRYARTGSVGDGKIFLLPVEDAIRIRTGESGEKVLQSHESSEEIPA